MQSRQGYTTTGGVSSVTSTPSVQGYATTNSAQTTSYAAYPSAPAPVIYPSTPSVQGYASTPGYATQTFFAQPRIIPGTTVIRTYNPNSSCSGCC